MLLFRQCIGFKAAVTDILGFKHIIFFAALIFGVPAMVVFFRSNPKIRRCGFFVAIFIIPIIQSTGINFWGDEHYRGTSRGFEVTLTTLITIGMLIALFLLARKIIFTPPGAWLYFVYFGISIISITNSEIYIYSGYELLKMINMYLFFLMVYNYTLYNKEFNTLLFSLAIFVIYNLFLMLYQKYVQGIYQTPGLFAHRNSASMYVNLIAPIFLSYILNNKLKRDEFYFFLFTFACCAINVVLALSRGAIFFFPVAAAIVTFFSVLNKLSPRKIAVIFGCCFIGFLGTLKAAPMVMDRFETAAPASGNTRIRLAKIAINMAEDKFWGVGLNNWGVKVNPPYTYSTERHTLSVGNLDEFKDGIVETVYLLTAAECGWIGLLSLLSWFAYYYVQSILNIRRYKKTPVYYLPIGILAGLTAIFGQSTLEWVLKQTPNFCEMMLIFAIVAAMTTVFRKQKKAIQKI